MGATPSVAGTGTVGDFQQYGLMHHQEYTFHFDVYLTRIV